MIKKLVKQEILKSNIASPHKIIRGTRQGTPPKIRIEENDDLQPEGGSPVS